MKLALQLWLIASLLLLAIIAHGQGTPVQNDSIYATPAFWGACPEEYSDYVQPIFNSTIASTPRLLQSGLTQYVWNTHINSLPGDNRSSVCVITSFGTNDSDGTQIEFLARKAGYAADLDSGLFAHPLRLDGAGGVMVGNIPETMHTKNYPANAYLDIWTGTSASKPAVRFEQDTLTTTPLAGSLERGHGELWWTDGSGNRMLVMTTPTNVFCHVSGTNVFFSTVP